MELGLFLLLGRPPSLDVGRIWSGDVLHFEEIHFGGFIDAPRTMLFLARLEDFTVFFFSSIVVVDML